MFRTACEILKLINRIFEGGVRKFTEEGGAVSMTLASDKAIIYHPDPPRGFLKKLSDNSDLGIPFEIVKENNMGESGSEEFGQIVFQTLAGAGIDVEKVSFNRAYLTVTIDGDRSDARETVKALLEGIPVLMRGEVAFQDEIVSFSRDDCRNSAFSEHSDRDLPITDENLMDLKILLYGKEMDVLEFIDLF